jgi:23S rRNA (adenine2503-C2)-methyltransferase
MAERHPLPSIFDHSLEELSDLITAWGHPSYRAIQLWNGLYRKRAASLDEITTLPEEIKQRLGSTFTFTSLQPVIALDSTDGETHKILFELPDKARIETVLMKYKRRRTLCISSQAGCAMSCSFCATGQMGFTRNLSAGEIVEQVIHFARLLDQEDDALTNVVFMGMGEPFHNYDAVMKSIDILNHQDGFNFGARRFTISTVGLIPGIERFTGENSQVNLAISLHSTDDTRRSELMPVNRRYPIEDLIAACRRYFEATNRRVTFEWALIQYVNDSIEEADRLADLLTGLTCHVNVIPLNPTEGFAGNRSENHRVLAFRDHLQSRGIPCTIRIRRGIDINAGCGQLAYKHR